VHEVMLLLYAQIKLVNPMNDNKSVFIISSSQENYKILRYNRILEGINRILSNVVEAKTQEELGNECLSVTLEATESQYGFVAELGADGLLYNTAISDMGWENCMMYDELGQRCPLGAFLVHGLYSSVIKDMKSFYTNDPSSHPDSLGLPSGHPSLTSFLGVPLLEEGKAVGMLAVANREGGYSGEQLEDLEAIAPAITQALKRKREEQERKQAEEALKKAHDSLEIKVKERTTELEEAYKSLRENERRLSEAQTMAHLGNWERDLATDKLYWSDEMYYVFGLKPQEFEINYNLFLNYIHPYDRVYMENSIKYALEGKPFDIDYRIILANREERIVHVQGEVVFNEENTPIKIRGVTQDVTERKKSEEKNKMLANVLESSDDAIVTGSLDGKITSWNKGAEKVYGYSADEILGKPVCTLAPSSLKEETSKLFEMVKQGEIIQQYETLRLRKDGTVINVSMTLSPVFDIYGRLTAISVVYRDITKRIKAEEALANLETARKKEIHHRIKNNLQVISSLLDLQAEKFKGKENISYSEVIEAFRESQDRVISMALIHEELYKGKDTDTFNFSSYIEKLTDNLFLTYRLENIDINLNIDMQENLYVDMDMSVPLGIIVNELVSNSFKHAFINRDSGEIKIKLYKKETEICKNENYCTAYSLSVSDNGVGIPENINFKELDTLGMQLVASLVEQLGGDLDIKRNDGTEFTITFTKKEKKNHVSMSAPKLFDND
jgi:PAS domain S-box-containing protein